MNETPDLLTTANRLALRPKEAAKALGISERLLWTKTNCNEVPHCRIGRARHDAHQWERAGEQRHQTRVALDNTVFHGPDDVRQARRKHRDITDALLARTLNDSPSLRLSSSLATRRRQIL